MKKLSFILLLLTQNVFAGNFDCSVIYDEFDSLMHKSFITNPGRYVRTQSHKISRSTYNSTQKSLFTQSKKNERMGIAVFRTNKNTYGKFMYTWGAPFNNGHPSLILKNIVKYGRVMDGYKKQTRSKIVVPSSYTVDLDTFTVGSGAESDIWFHNIDGRTMYLQAKNGANLHFPMESMCN